MAWPARRRLDTLLPWQRVLDLGAGGGGVAIACKLAGADVACVNDIDVCALVACELNQKANGITLDRFENRSLIDDGRAPRSRDWDVILAGGMLLPLWPLCP